MSQHQREDSQLADRIQEAYHASRQVYQGHVGVHVFMLNCRLRGFPARGNGWHV
jgi:hypothetical protein